MKTVAKLARIGDDLGLVLPAEALSVLNVVEGDMLSLTATPEGLSLVPVHGELDVQLALGRECLRDYSESFRQLADR